MYNLGVSGNSLEECYQKLCVLKSQLETLTPQPKNQATLTVDLQTGQVVPQIPGGLHSQSILEEMSLPQITSAEMNDLVGKAAFEKMLSQPRIPNATVPIQGFATDSVEKDSRGLPWDARIHSGSREKVESTGNWKKRRGVSEAMVASVESEYGLGQKPNVIAQPVQAAPIPTTEVLAKLPEAGSALEIVQQQPASAPTQASPAFAMPPTIPPNTYNPESFRTNLLNILQGLAASGKINNQWIQDQAPMFGGKPIYQWHEEVQTCNQLFENFVQWGLVNRL